MSDSFTRNLYLMYVCKINFKKLKISFNSLLGPTSRFSTLNSSETLVILPCWIEFQIQIIYTKFQSVLNSIIVVFQGTCGRIAHTSLKLTHKEERYYGFGVTFNFCFFFHITFLQIFDTQKQFVSKFGAYLHYNNFIFNLFFCISLLEYVNDVIQSHYRTCNELFWTVWLDEIRDRKQKRK